MPVVSLAIGSAAGRATLAYCTTVTPTFTPTESVTNAWRNLYIAAAVAAFGPAPYTRVLMMGTNDELMEGGDYYYSRRREGREGSSARNEVGKVEFEERSASLGCGGVGSLGECELRSDVLTISDLD
ncbi:hypothetical protein K469DRAFT_751528 [Zopfia rhizophila CBS 207.26]|uniref:Uncharacterized protein n=1 Tax=Zopfia rhizophila CBS 207.26 TaxID=1314779 RepID=A0A6A6DVB7_9PEZI|nr:hypothetical protein K469DRAFT_751528 [Zopfia rhizophila CBS 207.26]